MLGPFRIRNLHRSPPLHPALSGRTRSFSTLSDAIVCIDGEVYEDSIRQVPESKLKYRDADEDVVTVGSKDELVDRLAEPIYLKGRPKRRQGDQLVPLRPASPDMHVFEIDHMEAAIQFWRSMDISQSENVQEPIYQESAAVSAGNLAVEPVLEDKRVTYFRNSGPPQVHTEPIGGDSAEDGLDSCELSGDINNGSDNVLTSIGIKQAQQAGQQLRARLSHVEPHPHRNRVDRTKAVNSWATYSKNVTPTQRLRHANHGSALPKRSSVSSQEFSLTDGPSVDHADKSLDMEGLPAASWPSSRTAENTIQSMAGKSGSLQPQFFENVQRSLNKLSPIQSLSQTVHPSGFVQEDEQRLKQVSAAHLSQEEGFQHEGQLEFSDELEIILIKTVFGTIREMVQSLDSMNTRFDTVLTPKLVEERLKSKNQLLPAHRQDTVRDLFALRHSIETFALKVAETKQTLTRLDKSNLFPEGTNLANLDSMATAANSFGELIRTMNEMIATARQGMLAAQLAEGETKYHIPRRLARVGFDDIWSLSIAPVPSHYSTRKVQDLLNEVRSEASLRPLDVGHICFYEGDERSVNIEIQGKSLAMETWTVLLNAPDRTSRLSLSERSVTLTRKHYPDVFHCSGAQEKVLKSPAAAATAASRADIDEARLTALQNRRAAWRREFKARTQSVRFQEPPQPDMNDLEEEKACSSTRAMSHMTSSNSEPWQVRLRTVDASALSNGKLLSPKDVHVEHDPCPHTLSDGKREHHLRRPRSAVFASTSTDHPHPNLLETQVRLDQDYFHRLRYPPGPFAPLPPNRLNRRRSDGLLKPLLHEAKEGSLRNSTSRLMKQAANIATATSEVKHQTPPLARPFIPAFPPLPPLEPLVPERCHLQTPVQPATSNVSIASKLPGAWPEADGSHSESSGAFVRRMMGRSPGPSCISPLSSPTTPINQSAKHIQRPVSPIDLSSHTDNNIELADTTNHETHQLSAPRYLQTVAQTSSTCAPIPRIWKRRPYSQTFDGAGRLGGGLGNAHGPLLNDQGSGATMIPMMQTDLPRNPCGSKMASPPLPGAATEPEVGSTTTEIGINSSMHSPHVSECAEQLKQLGYGDVHNGGESRLLMYAQMMDGDLGATIDIIEEEREAWQAHGTCTGCVASTRGARNV